MKGAGGLATPGDLRSSRHGSKAKAREVTAMLHRRFAAARPLLLLLVASLLFDNACTAAAAAALSSSGAQGTCPRCLLSGVYDGSEAEGMAARVVNAEAGTFVWTAAAATQNSRREEYPELLLALESPAAVVAVEPTDAASWPSEPWLQNRARQVLLGLRGGSEGLKEWSRERAAGTKAASRSRLPDDVLNDDVGGRPTKYQTEDGQAARYFERSGSGSAKGMGWTAEGGAPVAPPAPTASPKEARSVRLSEAADGAGESLIGLAATGSGAWARPHERKHRVGGDRQSALVAASGSESQRDSRKAAGQGEGSLPGAPEGDLQGGGRRGWVDARSAERAGANVGASSTAFGGAGAAPGSIDGRNGMQEPVAPTKPSAGDGDYGVYAAGPASASASASTAAAGVSSTSKASGSSGGSRSDVGGSGGGGSFELSAVRASAARSRRIAPAAAAAATREGRRNWQAAPPADGGAGGSRSGAGGYRAPGLPRAGAPPPPTGEVRVWRPWGQRHGAVPPAAQAGRVGSSDAGGGWGAAATSGVAGPGGVVAPTGVEGHGSAAARVAGRTAGQSEARKFRWEPKYLTVKAVFFLFYSSLGAIMPYLPVYYHSLGIPDRQIGHLGAITPAMTFVFTPLWGAMTDKSGMLKQILVLTFAASTLLRVSLAGRTSFPWIVSVITLTAVINAPVRPLLDSSALQSLDDRKEYGKQRLWGQWGFGIGSFLTGKLLSRFGFKAAFYMHAAFSLPTLLILLRFSPKKEDRGGKEPPKFGELYQLMMHETDVLVFFSMVFAIGLSSGVIENFAYKRLRELGGTGSVLGVSRLISSLSGIPMFFFSGAIVKNFSIVGILTASMMSFIARFVIYASIKNPWAGLPAEALRGVTFAGFWAASTCHVGAIAPPGLSTTMLGLLNATYGGIGQSLGSLIGGSLSTRLGTARAFLVYAGVDGCLLLAFFVFWVLHPNGQRKDRGAGGGISSSSGGWGGGSAGEGASKSIPPATPPPTTTTTRSPTLLDQKFPPPPPCSTRCSSNTSGVTQELGAR